MGIGEGLFRKSALEKLSSPEQLDVMMRVTSPTGWIALVGTGIILAFVVVWSVVGSIGIRVDGQGMLIRGAAVYDVSSGAQGRIEQVLVAAGDRIKKGQVVAKIAQPELTLKIANTKAGLVQLEAQRTASGQRGSSIVGQYQAQARALREKVGVQQRLVARGLLTNGTLLRTQEQLASTEALISQNKDSQSGQVIRVEDLKRQLKELEEQLASSTDIRSPYDGRVLEVTSSGGNMISPGTRLLTLEPLNAPLETVIYIPAGEGKKVRPGMQVRISPTTVKAEEYGFLVGKVKSVSEFPVTPEGLRKVLRNDKLVETLMGKSAPIEAVATLIPDASTPSGYRWSSSKGPPTQVNSGTLATASVVVESRTPISYVLPVVKRSLGGG
ncbi:MAG: NHLP bacteriocin system secretion protein [Acidobacteria bacterium]|nr:NHLP bacteriocin system secretion protein [Acidobacteriota bacterium]MCA1610166.1 NHLP bacteriocin system secretion protein [Acidobacteriota bacterium]MCA1617246.1 NHLP bacteriocin system secretion protein [Acidobacteriota bacterium]